MRRGAWPPSMKGTGGWLFLQRHLHEPQHGSLSALDILVELHRKLIFNTANVPQAGKPPRLIINLSLVVWMWWGSAVGPLRAPQKFQVNAGTRLNAERWAICADRYLGFSICASAIRSFPPNGRIAFRRTLGYPGRAFCLSVWPL